MSYLSEIENSIIKLNYWQRIALTAVCVESLSPVIKYFALSNTKDIFQKGLNIIWKSVCDREVDLQANFIKESLFNLPETLEKNSNVPAYDVMKVISVIYYSLESLSNNGEVKVVRDACSSVLNYYAGVDVIFLSKTELPRIVNSHNPPPIGKFKSLQMQEQIRSIKKLQTEVFSWADTINQLQVGAQEIAVQLDSVLPQYAKEMNWSN